MEYLTKSLHKYKTRSEADIMSTRIEAFYIIYYSFCHKLLIVTEKIWYRSP